MLDEDNNSYHQYREKKEKLFNGLSGSVLELGPGTDVKFEFYSNKRSSTGIEPNTAMHPYSIIKAPLRGINLKIDSGVAEQMDFEKNVFNNVISTIVLCSVKDVQKTSKEKFYNPL